MRSIFLAISLAVLFGCVNTPYVAPVNEPTATVKLPELGVPSKLFSSPTGGLVNVSMTITEIDENGCKAKPTRIKQELLDEENKIALPANKSLLISAGGLIEGYSNVNCTVKFVVNFKEGGQYDLYLAPQDSSGIAFRYQTCLVELRDTDYNLTPVGDYKSINCEKP